MISIEEITKVTGISENMVEQTIKTYYPEAYKNATYETRLIPEQVTYVNQNIRLFPLSHMEITDMTLVMMANWYEITTPEESWEEYE